MVLYCGQDRAFAEEIIRDFEKETGIRVAIRSDTEANKSVSLYQALVREAARPRCDVFWNGEILNTIRLDQQGLLQTYDSPAAAPFPGWARSPNKTWYAFAARARVLIVHKRLRKEERPDSIFELAEPQWRGRVAIAKPLFGTTATHAVCLFQVLGVDEAQKFFRELRANVAILPGNKDVALAVADGKYDVGFTDTDDAIIEVRRGRPVEIVYPDQDGIGTLFIPNTVALIRGGPNPKAGRLLLDYLLSPRVEGRLAQGRSAQIPLNPQVQVRPPVETPSTVKAMAVDFAAAARLWTQAQTFLRQEFTRP